MKNKYLYLLIISGICIVSAILYGRRIDARLEPCNEHWISVEISNYTVSTIRGVRFELEAWKGGVTQNVLGKSHRYIPTKIGPFSSVRWCIYDEYFDYDLALGEGRKPTLNDQGFVERSTAIRIFVEANWFEERKKGLELHLHSAQFRDLEE